ncbi:hypothetical protein EDB80DRAFT_3358 [Ilyonectria destructans]|nr:hypothetical protein EDB80DRAFT_3358 [Ilyonectria destructans]
MRPGQGHNFVLARYPARQSSAAREIEVTLDAPGSVPCRPIEQATRLDLAVRPSVARGRCPGRLAKLRLSPGRLRGIQRCDMVEQSLYNHATSAPEGPPGSGEAASGSGGHRIASRAAFACPSDAVSSLLPGVPSGRGAMIAGSRDTGSSRGGGCAICAGDQGRPSPGSTPSGLGGSSMPAAPRLLARLAGPPDGRLEQAPAAWP